MTSQRAGTSYPRLAARTRNFTLGVPGGFRIAPDGSRIAFLRAASGTDRTSQLWVYDVAAGAERLVVDPVTLLGPGAEELSAEERAQRERARQAGAGVVGYTTDAAVTSAVFALSSRLWLADLVGGAIREIPAAGAVLDPGVDPAGARIAYVAGGSLHVVRVDGSDTQVLATPDGDEVTWGLAEFVAAEEMDRHVGYWWAPDGDSLLVERADAAPIQVWHIADPANPEREPASVRYPAAGTSNADVTLWHLTLDGGRSEIAWDRSGYEYLGRVDWSGSGPPLLQVLSRDQRSARVLEVDLPTGATTSVGEEHDPAWVDLLPGVPSRLPDGRIVTVVRAGDVRRVAIDGVPTGPADLDVRSVLGTGARGVLVVASAGLGEHQVSLIAPDGAARAVTTEAGVHTAAVSSTLTVVTSSTLSDDRATVRVLRDGAEIGRIASHQEPMPFRPSVALCRLGSDGLPSAVLFPRDHPPGSARLPVLLDPYGGPHGQRVVASARAFGASQWLADQGFCVLVTDGRGTPGRGPAWERRVRLDFLGTLDDQVAALESLVAAYPDDVDPRRVGIRGWSYGGYLSALAVLRRPDVFHAAVAGAPVTDWTLYDTAYTERYLGHPADEPEVYRRNSLIDCARGLRRPLLLIHGLADDNVVVAHTLRLSSALLAAGRPHSVLPLSGVTHMASQEEVAENLLRLQVDFLRRALAEPAD